MLWRGLAEVAEKTVKKGTQLYITGKIKTRSYVDKDGNNKYITEILADTMFVLDRKQGTATTSSGTGGEQASPAPPPYNSNGNKITDIIKEPEKPVDLNDNGDYMAKTEDDLPF